MSNLDVMLPDAVILTGDDVLARFEQAYAAFMVRQEADLQEWFLAMEVWSQERAYFKQLQVQADALLDRAYETAWKAVKEPYQAFWWKLPWIRDCLDLRLVPRIVAKEDELYAAFCAAEGIPPDVNDWSRPKRPSSGGTAAAAAKTSLWARVQGLLEQAQAMPTQSFVVPLDVMALVSGPKEHVCHDSSAGF